MRFISILFCFSCLIFSKSEAQLPLIERNQGAPKQRFIDNMFFGGTFGLQFGTRTYVELAPIIGYKINPRFSAGMGLKYIYYKINDPYYNYSSNLYGGGPFLRYFLFEGLFAHAEYEVLNMEVPVAPYYINYTRENITSIFLGGGYRQLIGNNSAMDFLILYNVNESLYSPYSNPIFRIGFRFGF